MTEWRWFWAADELDPEIVKVDVNTTGGCPSFDVHRTGNTGSSFTERDTPEGTWGPAVEPPIWNPNRPEEPPWGWD